MSESEPTNENLIEGLAAIPSQMEALAPHAAKTLAPSASRDEWSPSEIIGHLCDAAQYWGARMRRVVLEDNPTLEVFDENMLVRLGAHRYWPLETLLRQFRLLSNANVTFLRGLALADWERAGVHESRGRLTLREIVTIEAEHEQGHVRQFTQAVESGESA